MNSIKKLSEEILLEMIQEIERKNMPQVKGKDIDEVLKIFDDCGIKYEQGKVKCGDLKPVQEDFIPEKLESLKKKIQEEDWVTHPLFVSKEGQILDGHHRWLAYKQIYGDDFQIPVTKVDLPVAQALRIFDKSADKVNEEIIKEEKKIDKIVAVVAGRFQPFHIGHYSLYELAAKKFGKKNTFIGTSNVVDPTKSPFNFVEKREIISKMFDIPKNNIVKVKSPYDPMEIKSKFDPNTTAYVTVFSDKDAGRLTNGKYFKKWTGKDLKGYDQEGYYIVAPVAKINVNGKNVSGEQLRNLFGGDKSLEEKKKIFKEVYGKFDQKIFDLIVNKLNESFIIGSSVIEDFFIVVNVKQLLQETTQATDAEVDDGPATFYKHPEDYRGDIDKITSKLGWQIIDYLAGEKEQYADQTYKYDHVSDVSFGDVGVRDTSYPDPLKKYEDFITRVAIRLGYEFVDWLIGDQKGEKIIDDPEKEMALFEPLKQNTSDAGKVKEEKLFTKKWWKNSLLYEEVK